MYDGALPLCWFVAAVALARGGMSCNKSQIAQDAGENDRN
jgi:hypothetical protein